MPLGTVKWFDSAKGFGFIAPDEGGRDAFVHYSEVENARFRVLEDHQRVSYTLAFDEKIDLPLTIAAAPSDGSAGGTIPADAAVTVVLYRDLTVTDNFAFRAEELTAARITTILEAVRRLAEAD